jgi:hypothetical protein
MFLRKPFRLCDLWNIPFGGDLSVCADKQRFKIPMIVGAVLGVVKNVIELKQADNLISRHELSVVERNPTKLPQSCGELVL